MKIRRATIKDLPQILKLSLALFKYERRFTKTYNLNWTYSKVGRDYFKERITKKDGLVFVAEDKNKIIGYICGYFGNWFFRLKPKMAEIDNMYVTKSYRQQGVGGRLIENFIAEIKKMGVSRIKVEALFANDLTRKFYEKNNFHPHSIYFEREL